MKKIRVLSLILISTVLFGCSEPAPECWNSTAKELLKDLAKENYNENVVGIEEITEMEILTNTTPQRRACAARLVTKYNKKDGTYKYFNMNYTVRRTRGEYGTYYITITDAIRK